MNAVGYIRVSTEDQAKEGVSLDNQRQKIKSYCQLKDLTLEKIIKDSGISAKNLNRPGVQKVITMARKKEIDAVVVFKLDRIFRSTVDAIETTKMFDKMGISFHSIFETLDTKSAMGRLFFTLTAALAEMERRIIGERTKEALAYKRSRNEKTGGDIPYGFNLTENRLLVENEDEQGVIRLIHRLKQQGLSLRKISKKLEQEGFKTKRGNGHWHPQTVSAILKRTSS